MGSVMGTSWSFGERDYRAIEDALMGSDYGRWFLSEYLARNRSEETRSLLEALKRLEASLAATGGEDNTLWRLRQVALELDAALGDALARITPDRPDPANEAPVDTILEAVEDINSFLEALGQRRVQQRLPQKIRARLTHIQQSCAHVDAGTEEARSLAEILTDLRRRLNAVGADLEGRAEDSAPQLPRKLLDELAAAFSDEGAAMSCG